MAESGERFSTVLLFGSPGAGKGTQGKVLAQLPGFFHLSSGDIFRSLDPDSDEARDVFEYTSRGELAPDDLTIRIWRKWLSTQIAVSRYKPNEEILVLDGIPRNLHQCELTAPHIDVLKIIYLTNSDELTMIRRIKRRALIEGRTDDADESVIRRRFKVYREETAPVLEFFPKDIVVSIDSLGTAAEVLFRMLEALIPVQNEFLRTRVSRRTI